MEPAELQQAAIARHPLRAAFTAFLVSTPAMIALLATRAPLPLILAAALVDGSTGTLFNVFWFTAMRPRYPAPRAHA